MAKCTEIMPSYAWEMTFFGWIVQMAKTLPEKTLKNQGLRFKLLFCWEIAFSYVDECWKCTSKFSFRWVRGSKKACHYGSRLGIPKSYQKNKLQRWTWVLSALQILVVSPSLCLGKCNLQKYNRKTTEKIQPTKLQKNAFEKMRVPKVQKKMRKNAFEKMRLPKMWKKCVWKNATSKNAKIMRLKKCDFQKCDKNAFWH